jgi:hypothetical protein
MTRVKLLASFTVKNVDEKAHRKALLFTGKFCSAGQIRTDDLGAAAPRDTGLHVA